MPRQRTTPAQLIGDSGETLAAERLAEAGWTILGRNVRFGRDELDLVATDPGPPAALVVVEVRRRGRRDFGLAEETLDHRKRVALRRGGENLGTVLGARLKDAAIPAHRIRKLPPFLDGQGNGLLTIDVLARLGGVNGLQGVLPDGMQLPHLPLRVDLIAIDEGPDGRPSMRHHRAIRP